MKQIAFITSAEHTSLAEDDRLAAAALVAKGCAVHAAVWDNPFVPWETYDAVILRSCWDYHLRPEAFLELVTTIESMEVPIWNPSAVVRWNFEKSYLASLERRGIATIPTLWFERGAEVDLAAELAARGWERAVVKPTISLSAYQTWVTTPETAATDAEAVRAILERSGVMVQEFVDEVCTRGEWSFVFLGGEYSHAVIKRPAEGDFRVQANFGGTGEAAEPPAHLLEDAVRVVEPWSDGLLYARVDGIEVDGRLLLMELELIDPVLFFGQSPEAAVRFASALLVRS